MGRRQTSTGWSRTSRSHLTFRSSRRMAPGKWLHVTFDDDGSRLATANSAISLRRPNNALSHKSASPQVTPLKFAPGRARLSMNPSAIGSETKAITTGVVTPTCLSLRPVRSMYVVVHRFFHCATRAFAIVGWPRSLHPVSVSNVLFHPAPPKTQVMRYRTKTSTPRAQRCARTRRRRPDRYHCRSCDSRARR